MKGFVKPGATVWALTRQRLRAGQGPHPITVAEVNSELARAVGTRGWYSPAELFETGAEARIAWAERATSELFRETSRYNKIAARLSAWERA